MLLNSFANSIPLLLQSCLFIFLAFLLSFLYGFDGLGSLRSLPSLDLSNTLVSWLDYLLLLLLNIFIDRLVDLGLGLELFHLVCDFALLVHLGHGFGLVVCCDSLDHLGVWST